MPVILDVKISVTALSYMEACMNMTKDVMTSAVKIIVMITFMYGNYTIVVRSLSSSLNEYHNWN